MRNSILIIALLFMIGCASSEDEKKFLKDYKLLYLDGESCNNCIIKVKKNHIYDIIINKQKVDEGSWNLENPLDFPGFVLHLENGPTTMIYRSDTVIDYIDRRDITPRKASDVFNFD